MAGHGPFLADIGFHNLSEPLNTASADPNGCAALHPSATYAIRLLFASSVHEQGPHSFLLPFGTSNSAASVFSLITGTDGTEPSPDTLLGLADVDGDNVLDLCILGSTSEPQVDSVYIDCSVTGLELLAPDHDACQKPIVRYQNRTLAVLLQTSS